MCWSMVIIVNICEKFHYDRLGNDRALGNGKSDNNKNKNNVCSDLGTWFQVQKVQSNTNCSVYVSTDVISEMNNLQYRCRNYEEMLFFFVCFLYHLLLVLSVNSLQRSSHLLVSGWQPTWKTWKSHGLSYWSGK